MRIAPCIPLGGLGELEERGKHDKSPQADASHHVQQPLKGDLRKLMKQYALPVLAPRSTNIDFEDGLEVTQHALTVLENFNAALATNNAEALENCFFTEQAFWKDQLALTWHLRTFISPSKITSALLEVQQQRDLTRLFEIRGEADFVQVGPNLSFITCEFSFQTASPAATCSGRIWLLPIETPDSESDIQGLTWKIWMLSTKLDHLDGYAEDQALLRAPKKSKAESSIFETDVFIVGGGNAAAALAARLKALGVSSLMADRNAHVGDSWALRYESLKFHVPTSFCELPYMDYSSELRESVLKKDDLVAHLKRFVQSFGLDVVNSVTITNTTTSGDGRWEIAFQTPEGTYTAIARHLVQATGIGSQVPHAPSIPEQQAYNGIAIHSSQYKNADKLKEQGAKSVCVVGSANTAFDVLEDCYNAGLQVTMIVRSPQYLVPLGYVCNPLGLGAYNFGVEAADRLFMMMPTIVDSQLAKGLFAQLASQEPDRYSALRNVGFPVIDSTDPEASLAHNLIERGGGHYVDTGATELLAEGKVGFRAGVEPQAYTKFGLHLSDDTTLDADAVIWCTGFADKDACETVADIMKIPLPVDATWGVDEEGEIRGMWKRHSKVDNYWVMGGFTQQHRWHSNTLAQQIKASLEGVLPPPYLGGSPNPTDNI
ncbi:unnamed protein product [Aureobasidium vineae]|uniref:FAD/NAD(P)-binding domain-containing protein n=1 Tax=Aureobasidium vineae TaxID=2773715 RepID=A0A9N8JEK0_9PEZI|nr:unnamed protein product [Aureobasidium vineae]